MSVSEDASAAAPEAPGWEGPKRGEQWAPPEMVKAKDLVLRKAEELVARGQPAYEAYSKELILLAKQTLLPAEATDADLYYLFQLAGRYGLDPFTKEIWLIPMKRKNAKGDWEKRAVPLIGRDGMFALAERNPYYRGHRAAVVHANDEYEVLAEPRLLPSGLLSYVRHVCKGFGVDARGKVLGAWCEVYLEGRHPVLFEAELAQYVPSNLNDFSPWKNTPDVMMKKVALVNAYREAVRVSGVYAQEEFDGMLSRGVQHELVEPAEPVGVVYPDDPWWAARLVALFDAAEAVRPGSHLPAKRALLLEGAAAAEDQEVGLERLEAQLEEFIHEAGGEVPPSAHRDVEPGDEVVVDGEWFDAPTDDVVAGPLEQPTLLEE